VQDALYDAEEHLRAELAQHPGDNEGDVLGRIVSTYGAPDEVADAYRANEVTIQAALRTPRPRPRESALGRFFGVYADPRAYLSLLYMLLALVTGIVYFTFAVIGLSLSVGLAILIIGVPFFLLFVGIARVVALAEGRIVESMLGTRMPRRPMYPDRETPFLQRIVEMLKDPRTWGTLVYLVAMLPLGVFYFTFAVVGIAVSLAMFVAPIVALLYHAASSTSKARSRRPRSCCRSSRSWASCCSPSRCISHGESVTCMANWRRHCSFRPAARTDTPRLQAPFTALFAILISGCGHAGDGAPAAPPAARKSSADRRTKASCARACRARSTRKSTGPRTCRSAWAARDRR